MTRGVPKPPGEPQSHLTRPSALTLWVNLSWHPPGSSGMPLDLQDSFRNRKWKVCCLKYFRLRVWQRKRGVCVSIREGLVWRHPGGLVGSQAGLRRPDLGGFFVQQRLLVLRDRCAGMAGPRSCLFPSCSLLRQGKRLWADAQESKHMHFNISSSLTVSELVPPPRWKKDGGPLWHAG